MAAHADGVVNERATGIHCWLGVQRGATTVEIHVEIHQKQNYSMAHVTISGNITKQFYILLQRYLQE